MTNMPEAKLAREAELCYATVAMVTDYDCWHPDHDHVTVEQIIAVLLANADRRARSSRRVPRIAARPEALPARLPHRARPRPDHRARGARSGGAAQARRGGGPRAEGREMKVGGQPMRTIWREPDGAGRHHRSDAAAASTSRSPGCERCAEAAHAIRAMQVRGAPLIGATAAYGVALALRADAGDAALEAACAALLATRPTAVNLRWAIEDMRRVLPPLPPAARADAAFARAAEICDEDVAINRAHRRAWRWR